jgi:transposase InsO family protein
MKKQKKKARAPGGGSRRRPEAGPRRASYSPEQRREAVEAFQKSDMTREQFARTWGVSTASLSAWCKAYREQGPKGLENRYRGKKKPTAKSKAVKEAIKETNKQFPSFGLRKIRDHMARFCGLRTSPSTIKKTLNESGIERQTVKKKPTRKKKVRRFERARPNQMWQSDITSYVLPRSGHRCYLTVFLDDHSRYVVSWNLALHQKQTLVNEALLLGMDRFGKPVEVLTDQGRQYFSWRGKSEFQKLLAKQGISHVVSRTHHPQTLGKCERLWKTVGEELWDRTKPQGLEEARERLDHFFAHYNHHRPHQGIEGLVPADRFFSVADEVRQAIEANIADNELKLALGEAPRSPVYLVGQIGEQKVSMHGEQGKVVFQTPGGEVTEIKSQNLGIPKEEKDGSTGKYQPNKENTPLNGQEIAQSQFQDARAGADPGAGSVGGGFSGAEAQSPSNECGDSGDVAGQGLTQGNSPTSGDAAFEDLAIEPAGADGDGGGSAHTAQEMPQAEGDFQSRRRGQHLEAESQDHPLGEAANQCGNPHFLAETDASPTGAEQGEESCQKDKYPWPQNEPSE